MSVPRLHLKMPRSWRARCGIVLHEAVNEPRRIDDAATFVASPEAQRCRACSRSLAKDVPAEVRACRTAQRRRGDDS